MNSIFLLMVCFLSFFHAFSGHCVRNRTFELYHAPMKNFSYHNDFPYFFKSNACKSCGGKCCRGGQGYIWLSLQELETMAAARGISAEAFARQYVRRSKGQLSLQERIINGEHFCCLFDPVDRRCTMYENRPEQCRSFPFWEQFKEDWETLPHECPGVVRRQV